MPGPYLSFKYLSNPLFWKCYWMFSLKFICSMHKGLALNGLSRDIKHYLAVAQINKTYLYTFILNIVLMF